MNIQTPQAIFLVGLLLYIAIRAIHQKRAAGADITVRRSSPLDRVLVLLVILGQMVLPAIYLFTPWLDFANVRSVPGAAGWGSVAWIAGLWLFWRSHADLGKNWSVSLTLRTDHQLVTGGVYRVVRHPMYASFLLLALGQAFLLPNGVAGWFALAAVALMCIVRVPNEEAMMCERFGHDYRQYMKQTGAVVPRLSLGR